MLVKQPQCEVPSINRDHLRHARKAHFVHIPFATKQTRVFPPQSAHSIPCFHGSRVLNHRQAHDIRISGGSLRFALAPSAQAEDLARQSILRNLCPVIVRKVIESEVQTPGWSGHIDKIDIGITNPLAQPEMLFSTFVHFHIKAAHHLVKTFVESACWGGVPMADFSII